MNKHKLNADERLAAMQERLDRATAKSDLAQQMQVCADNRDALADRLNRIIAVAEWRRGKVRGQAYQIAALRKERDELRARITEMEVQIIELHKSLAPFMTVKMNDHER